MGWGMLEQVVVTGSLGGGHGRYDIMESRSIEVDYHLAKRDKHGI